MWGAEGRDEWKATDSWALASEFLMPEILGATYDS